MKTKLSLVMIAICAILFTGCGNEPEKASQYKVSKLNVPNLVESLLGKTEEETVKILEKNGFVMDNKYGVLTYKSESQEEVVEIYPEDHAAEIWIKKYAKKEDMDANKSAYIKSAQELYAKVSQDAHNLYKPLAWYSNVNNGHYYGEGIDNSFEGNYADFLSLLKSSAVIDNSYETAGSDNLRYYLDYASEGFDTDDFGRGVFEFGMEYELVSSRSK